MFVCVCRAVTEQEVKAVIADGATTVRAVTQACCAGDDCGACHGMIADMIEARWAADHAPCHPDARLEAPRHLPVLQGRQERAA